MAPDDSHRVSLLPNHYPKRTFDAARVNVAIGAHDIYDQEDLIIALTKVSRHTKVDI